MSGEQVARDAVQPFPIPLEIEMCFHPARDDSHLTDLRRVRFLLAGRQRARHFGKPLGEQVIVAMDARLVICKRHGAVELAFPRPVDFADVAKELGVGVARPQPGFFRQILQPARGQVAICAVGHNALPVGIVRGLNPELLGVRVRMARLIAECVR